MTRWFQLLVCRFTHDPPLHIADGRIWLRCTICGYESAGWRVHAPGIMKMVSK